MGIAKKARTAKNVIVGARRSSTCSRGWQGYGHLWCSARWCCCRSSCGSCGARLKGLRARLRRWRCWCSPRPLTSPLWSPPGVGVSTPSVLWRRSCSWTPLSGATVSASPSSGGGRSSWLRSSSGATTGGGAVFARNQRTQAAAQGGACGASTDARRRQVRGDAPNARGATPAPLAASPFRISRTTFSGRRTAGEGRRLSVSLTCRS